MGTLSIIEATRQEVAQQGNAAYPVMVISGEDGFNATAVTTSSTAASHTFGTGTEYVTIYADVDVYVLINNDTPVATTANLRIPANTPFSFKLVPASGSAISAIEAA